MVHRSSHNTRQIEDGAFRAHGFMDVSVNERLNVMEAHGPFNRELVLAADRVQEQVDPALAQARRWGSVLVFRGSALATPDAIAAIGDIVARRSAQGIRPVAIGLVMDASVEGGSLMAAHYLQAYARSDIPGEVFSDLQSASDWVLAQI